MDTDADKDGYGVHEWLLCMKNWKHENQKEESLCGKEKVCVSGIWLYNTDLLVEIEEI